MAFATRADLLARSSARRLAQLSVPTDMPMPPDDALRLAVSGGDLSALTADEQQAIAAALDAIDKALGDADALIGTYGIPATVQTTLLARLASTVALYYLQGAERMTEDVRKAYDATLDTLKAHSRGDLNLVPPSPTAPPLITSDVAYIESGSSRYPAVPGAGDW